MFASGSTGRGQSHSGDPTVDPAAFAEKIREMQERVEKAELEAKEAKKAVIAATGNSLKADLTARRAALFAMSRGKKPLGTICLRSYVIMTCQSVSSCLVEGTEAKIHGDIRLNDVACAGLLQKKGGMRHNWNTRCSPF